MSEVKGYRRLARSCLPKWFDEDMQKFRPETRSYDDWRDLADGLQALIDRSRDKVGDRTIRQLIMLRKRVLQQEEIMRTRLIDPGRAADPRAGEAQNAAARARRSQGGLRPNLTKFLSMKRCAGRLEEGFS